MKRKNIKRRKSGFTLIELMFVIAIIAVLASVAVPAFSSQTGVAEKSVCSANRQNLKTMVLTAYFSEEYDSFQDAFDAIYNSHAYTCPSGGHYTWIDNDGSIGSVVCNLHNSSTTSSGQSSGTASSSETSSGASGGTSSIASSMPSSGTSSIASSTVSSGASSTASSATSSIASSGTSSGGVSETVTLTDSASEKHTFHATEEWSVIQKKISSGWNIQDGYIFADSTGIYLCCSWSQPYLKEDAKSLTVEKMVSKYPDYFVKLDSKTRILIESDRVDSYGSMVWKSEVKKGTLCYIKGTYYVAPGTISVWTMPPGGWIIVKQ